jgi:multidrug resistance efflux pump
MIRFLALSFGVALIVLLGFLLEAQSQTPAPPPQAPPESYKIFAPGRVEGNTEEIELRPQTHGQIVSVLVREGDVVVAGQTLVQLDDAQHRHEVSLAESQLALAQAERSRLENGAWQFERDEAIALHSAKVAEMEQAQLSLTRTKRLRLESAVSQQEVDELNSKYRSLEGQVRAAKSRADLLNAPARADELAICDAKIAAAQSRLELAKVALERTALKALAPGQILRINVEPGELTGPESPQPTIILADTSRFRVRAFVEELDAPRLRPGMPVVVVADGLADQSFKGRVVQLSPRMTAKQIWNDDPAEQHDTKAREIWIDLEDSANLVVGLRVDVTIHSAQ